MNLFADYISEYIQGAIPAETMDGLLSVYKGAVECIGKEVFFETIGALRKHNMNINDTAKSLYLHRNTILFRLNKIHKHLGVDPMNNIHDCQLLFNILNYCQDSQ